MKANLSFGAVLVLLVPAVFGQWTPAPAGGPPPAAYPPGQYPDGGSSSPAPTEAGPENPDPADLQHGVARLSIVQGDVNIQRGDNGQLTAALANAPVMTHDQVQTSAGSRAELQFDEGTILRLGPDTALTVADLEFQRAQVQLGLGTLIFRVLPNAQTQLEIDTPSVGIRAVTQGEYRISVFDNGTSQITVRNGQLEVFGPRGSERIDSGRSVIVRGDASDPEMQTISEVQRDQFEQWSEDRDRDFDAPRSYQYVNAGVQGAADLDRYGNWVPSGYGEVWRPQGVAPDWSPYSDGQWSYTDYYGWTWIDYSPWGWAPYHYGRWFWNTGYGWCWFPGPRAYRAYWSPALVAFFGFGRVGVGFGGLGWVALAPYERCHPWWGGRNGYRDGFRDGYGIGSYRNSFVRGGAVTAAYNGFGGPHQRFTFATRSQIQGASAFSSRLPVSTTRASFVYSNRQPFASSHLAVAQSRSFFRSSSAAARTPNGFTGGNRNYGEAGAGWHSFGAPAPRSTVAGAASGPAARGYSAAGGGWQNFGQPSPAPRSSYHSFSNPQESSGWHSFGQAPPNTRNTYQAPRYSASPSYQAPRSSYPAGPYSNGRTPGNYTSGWSGANREQRSNNSGGRTQPQSAPQPRNSGGGHAESHSNNSGGGHHR